MEPIIIFIIITQHMVFDWICQSEYMATNKSKSDEVLMYHVAVVTYGLFMSGLTFMVMGLVENVVSVMTWVVLNSVGHFCTDYVTSRITAKAFSKGNNATFWNTIGIDQWIHYVMLFGLAALLL